MVCLHLGFSIKRFGKNREKNKRKNTNLYDYSVFMEGSCRRFVASPISGMVWLYCSLSLPSPLLLIPAIVPSFRTGERGETTVFLFTVYSSREAYSDPDSLNWLASSVVEHLAPY
jgi:hypothetical protein